tara:strand:- start:1844 stop:2125 length:282 start_codon:yes stop_codon:yes gene_type:complete
MTWTLPQTNQSTLFTSLEAPSVFKENSSTEFQAGSVSHETPSGSKWSSIERALGNTYTTINRSFTGLNRTVAGWLTGRRPASGLQYPRGIYNR